MRVKGKMSDSPFLHQCALAYLSDWDLLRTSALPHGLQWGTKGVVTASLDHTYVQRTYATCRDQHKNTNV
jgi:acyl-CoA thioesterase-2